MKFALAIFSLVLAVNAQHGQRCESPMYFQAKLREYDHVTNYYRRGELAYDAVEQRWNFLGVYQENSTHPQFYTVVRHDLKKEYTVDLKTKNCTVTELTRPFHPIATPQDARFVGENSIGVQDKVGEGVMLATWDYHVKEGDYEGQTTATFTKFDCIPVEEMHVGHDAKLKKDYRLHVLYTDVTLGLSDPDMFEIPEECRK